MNKNNLSQQSLSPTFQETVAQIRADYPEESKNVTFVDTAARNWQQGVKEYLEKISPAARNKHVDKVLTGYVAKLNLRRKSIKPLNLPTNTEDKIRMYLRALQEYGSSFTHKDFETGHAIVVIMKETNLRSDRKGTVYHEFGHIAVPGGMHDNRNEKYKIRAESEASGIILKTEIAADVFECLNEMQKNPAGAKAVANLSLTRAFEYFGFGGTKHLTTIALDKILVTEKDTIQSLTPEQIKAVAAAHAQECEITGEDFQYLGYVHAKWSSASWRFENLPPAEKRAQEMVVFARWAHEYEDENSNTYYIADKILRHVLKTGEIPYPTVQKVDTSIPEWDEIKQRLAERRPAAEIRVEKWRQQSSPSLG
jgi:hypothetical protein